MTKDLFKGIFGSSNSKITSNDSRIKIDNRKFYTKAIKEHGISAKGVRWHSKQSQYARFEVLTDFIKNDIKSSSIIDAGCGFGEYYVYLQNEDMLPMHYIGYDLLEDMILLSKKRFFDIEFKQKDILNDELQTADYYVCSGAMNTLGIFETFLFIKRCYEVSKKGFVFNLLKEKSYNGLEIDDVLEYCGRFCSDIKVKDGYLYNDITFFLPKL
ncbi:class I SAM-dependent methyltransferase [Arcobacter sp. FWKO B]|uniref:class I SAM-dependent methyltransferase n=1 Tax=Arcobacter sp. FWKO B TaxID=2593672 RepID=UPI0018A579E2|nr:class I SAM-dependent methyltransferase [Arcobacter sp. FWKO B]QOG12250.1 class I SAM-dependent methyltransferase [Arcobacter sp. FWKO B]